MTDWMWVRVMQHWAHEWLLRIQPEYHEHTQRYGDLQRLLSQPSLTPIGANKLYYRISSSGFISTSKLSSLSASLHLSLLM